MMAAGGGRTSSSLHVSGTTEARSCFLRCSSVLCSPSTLYTGLSLTPRPRYIVTPSITPHHTASHVTEIPPVICSFSLCFSSHHTWPDLGTRCLDPDIVQRRGWWSLYTAVSRLLLARLPRLLRDLTMLPGCSRGRVSWPRATCHVSPDERVGVKHDNLTTF